MFELGHSVIIQINETMSTFHHKCLAIGTKQEFCRYLIMDLIGKQKNMWDIDLMKLFHLYDPGCNIASMFRVE